MRPSNVWQALARPGYLKSAWPLRAAVYLLTGIPLGLLILLALAAGVVFGVVLSVVLVGLPLLALTPLSGVPFAALERRRLRLIDDAPAPDLHRRPAEPGLRSWAGLRVREKATWRELGYAVLSALILWPLEALALTFLLGAPLWLMAAPALLAIDGKEVKVLKTWLITGYPAAFGWALAGLVLLFLATYALGVVAGARAELARLLISPRDVVLGEQVAQLASSRVRLVDAFESERRRIERDLHDGAQQRLVALTMSLGLARLDAPEGPLADQLARAQGEAEAALTELRELIQGIHPAVLTDYGLAAALADVADRSPVPVDIRITADGRFPAAIESALYFVVREALANVSKHSGAHRAWLRLDHAGGELRLEVTDDGRGGADPARGTGLTGLADRVSVVDGRLSVSSPVGGPTVLLVEIPCESTDPSG